MKCNFVFFKTYSKKHLEHFEQQEQEQEQEQEQVHGETLMRKVLLL